MSLRLRMCKIQLVLLPTYKKENRHLSYIYSSVRVDWRKTSMCEFD